MDTLGHTLPLRPLCLILHVFG